MIMKNGFQFLYLRKQGSISMITIVQDVFSFFASNSFASGILVGVLGALVYAFLMARIRPSIKFAKYISKRHAIKDETRSGVKYLFEFRNVGWRDIIEVEMSARLVVRGMHPKYPRNFTYYSIPLGYTSLPKVKRWPIVEEILALLIVMRLMKRTKQQKKTRKEPLWHFTRLDVHGIQELDPHYINFLFGKLQENQTIHDEFARYKITASNLKDDPQLLELLLELGDGSDVSYIEINISGYDSLSGTKRLFTKTYQRKDILAKDFYGNDLTVPGRSVMS
jgi:hypothetical protein